MRLRFNYVWIFLAILMAWLAKLAVHPRQAESGMEVVRRMAVGPLGGGAVLVATVAFYGAVAWLAAWGGGGGRGGDEVRGLEKEIGQWKT